MCACVCLLSVMKCVCLLDNICYRSLGEHLMSAHAGRSYFPVKLAPMQPMGDSKGGLGTQVVPGCCEALQDRVGFGVR